MNIVLYSNAPITNFLLGVLVAGGNVQEIAQTLPDKKPPKLGHRQEWQRNHNPSGDKTNERTIH